MAHSPVWLQQAAALRADHEDHLSFAAVGYTKYAYRFSRMSKFPVFRQAMMFISRPGTVAAETPARAVQFQESDSHNKDYQSPALQWSEGRDEETS